MGLCSPFGGVSVEMMVICVYGHLQSFILVCCNFKWNKKSVSTKKCEKKKPTGC